MASVENSHNNRPTANVNVEVATYDPGLGIGTWWDEGALLRAEIWPSLEQMVVISGNAAGLMSLARHLLTLAQSPVPDGSHLDFDTYSGALTSDSLALRVEVEKR